MHWLRPRARRRDEGGQLEEGRATARARLESLARGAAHELVKGLAHLGRVRGLGLVAGGGGPRSVRWRRLVGVVVVRRCGMLVCRGGDGVRCVVEVVVCW